MSDPSIRVQDVAKRFHRGERCDSVYGLVARQIARPFGFRQQRADTSFWALGGVSLEVFPGEAVGIIGHNGAGKSTLLKLLAGIMRQDRGSINVHGRISALIEVGAGFHPSLTGRENIFLSAAILGIPRRDVRASLDGIIDFAGVREHIDTPVKHYSSGMHARLGFSIAVHARPDVLLVDEVLSVGDREFRGRCMERMREFLTHGVAIAFVSHDLDTVQRFCPRTVVLNEGRVSFAGESGEAINRYKMDNRSTVLETGPDGQPLAIVRRPQLLDDRGRPIDLCRPGDFVSLAYDVDFKTPVAHPSFGLSIARVRDWLTVYETSSTRQGADDAPIAPGETRRVQCSFAMNLAPGEYTLGLHVRDRDSLRYLAHNLDEMRIRVEGESMGEGAGYLNPAAGRTVTCASAALAEVLPSGESPREVVSAGAPSR